MRVLLFALQAAGFAFGFDAGVVGLANGGDGLPRGGAREDAAGARPAFAVVRDGIVRLPWIIAKEGLARPSASAPIDGVAGASSSGP